MTPEQWRLATALFHDALAQDPSARQAFLDKSCAVDNEVRAEVDRLLAAHCAAGRFGEASLAPPDNHRDAAASESGTTSVRRHPFTWLVAIAGLIAAAMFTQAASLLIMNRGTTATFGWTEARRSGESVIVRVDRPGPAEGLLEPGDRVVSFDGKPPVGPGGTALYRRAISIGQTYRLAIDRRGKRFELALVLAEGPSALGTRLTYFAACLVWCVIGLFIGWARPDHAPARLAFGASVTTGLGFLSAAVMQGGTLFHPLHVVLGYHFFCRFATGSPAAGVWRGILIAMYGFGIVPFMLGLWVQATRLSQGPAGVAELMTEYGPLIAVRPMLAVSVFYASLVLMVTVVAYNYRRLTSEEQRRRVRWVTYVSTIALTPQIVLSAAGLMGRPAGGTAWTFANVFTVLIPLVVAYAVVRHRVFDIKVVVRRTVQYLLARQVLQAAVVAPIAALVYIAVSHRQLTIAELTNETQAYLYFVAATGIVLRYRRPIEAVLDRQFFREEHDRELVLLGMLEEVSKVDSIAELSRLVSDRLTAVLHPARANVWYRDPEELAASSSSDPLITPPDIPSSSRWLAWLEERNAPAEFPVPAEAGLSIAERRWFEERGVTMAVPITDSDDRLIGALFLGAKKSEERYSAADRRLLGAIAQQAAVVRETLRLRARVSQEVRVRHDVLARLDDRLPDLLKECPECGACFESPTDRCPHDGAPLALSLPVARTVDRKYRLERVIGKGGMGAVYEARDLRLDRTVAVKVMLSHAFGHETALRRFRREARAAARLNHPNIVAVYDFGSFEAGGAYLVMERVHGVTLRAELDDHQRILSPAAAAQWFGPLLDALAAAHAAGIIHRDIKPENVMGVRDDAGGLGVKLLDLGLVKLRAEDAAVSATMTAEGIVMGTLGYMSPEQRLGREVDERTDIFAVGIMLREAITGQKPSSEHASGMTEPLPLPGSPLESSRAARALDNLVHQCLAPDPRDRFPSAAELRKELMPLLLSLQSAPGTSKESTRQSH